jgi:nitrogen regulatory protein P-II 1
VKKVTAVIRPDRLDEVSLTLERAGLGGFTITDVRGHGQSPSATGEWRGSAYEIHVTHKIEIGVIVDDEEVIACVNAIISGAYTGNVGDGLVTVSDLAAVYQIRAGAPEAPAAL